MTRNFVSMTILKLIYFIIKIFFNFIFIIDYKVNGVVRGIFLKKCLKNLQSLNGLAVRPAIYKYKLSRERSFAWKLNFRFKGSVCEK